MKSIKKILLLIVLCAPSIVFAEDYLTCGSKTYPLVFANVFSTLFNLIRILVPIIFVITGMVAFVKATISSKTDEGIDKAKEKLIRNSIAAIIIFFIMSIINFAVLLVSGTNNTFTSCLDCLLHPKNCQVVPVSSKLCSGLLGEQGMYDENCNLIQSKPNTDYGSGSHGVEYVDPTPSKPNNPNITPGSGKADKVDVQKNDGVTYINGILIVNKSYSIPSSYAPAGADGKYECLDCLTSETKSAYNEMVSAASSDGVSLKIVSGYRSYKKQKDLYDARAKVNKANADAGTARPGNSEHQTGLAFDLNQVSQSFANTKAGKWVNNNCYKYGFVIRYPKGKDDKTGFKFEPWHLRYVGKELAQELYNNGSWISIEEYFNIPSEYSD